VVTSRESDSKKRESEFLASLGLAPSFKPDLKKKDDWNMPHKMGTSIMAVKFDGGVVIGADSRTSTGSYVSNRASDKLSPVSSHIYCARSGSAADTQAISDIVAYYLTIHSIESGAPPLVKTAATCFQSVCYNNKDRLLAGIILAGWDSLHGGQVYNISLGGSLVRENWSIGGSGSSYIYGYVDANYKPNLSRGDSIDFVTKALSHAMSRDGSSGGLIRLAVIDKDGVEKIFVPGDKLPVLG